MNTIRNILLAAVAATALASGSLPAAAYDSFDRSFSVTDVGNWDVTHVYATDVDTGRWGPDLLGRYVVEAGDSETVDLPDSQYARGYCMFDIKLVFENGRQQIIPGVNLCEAYEIVTDGLAYQIND